MNNNNNKIKSSMNTINENIRRDKIRSSLKKYFQTDKGILHRKKISAIQAERMAKYAEYLNNNILKNISNEEEN